MNSTARVLVHADVELSAIDGSTSWLISVARACALAGAKVDVLARNVPSRSIVVDEIRSDGMVRVVYPNSASHNGPDVISAEIGRLARAESYAMIIVRGANTAEICLADDAVRQRLWVYLSEFPSISSIATGVDYSRWQRLAEGARGVLAQTSWLRSYVEGMVPRAASKIEVLEPMVPDRFFGLNPHVGLPGEPLRIGYAGKFDKPWHALEIPSLVEMLRDRGVEASVTLHGDKVQAAKDEPGWHVRMRSVMENPPRGVAFPGAIERSQVGDFMASCDVGIGWRASTLDSSFEVSTKLLEFSACGVPVVCNRTAIHEELLGEDYPLFTRDSIEEVVTVLARFAADDTSRRDLSGRVRERVVRYSFLQAAERLRELIGRESAFVEASNRERGLRVAYLRHPGGGSERLSHLLDSIVGIRCDTVDLQWQLSRNETLCRQTDWTEYDLAIVDWHAKSFDLAQLALHDVPVVAWAHGWAEAIDTGFANRNRLRGISAVFAAPSFYGELVGMVDWLPVREVDAHTSVQSGRVSDESRPVGCALFRGDMSGLRQLREFLASLSDCAGIVGPLDIVLMDAKFDRGPAGGISIERFDRDLEFLLSEYSEVLPSALASVSTYEGSWLREFRALALLGAAGADRWLSESAISAGAEAFVWGAEEAVIPGVREFVRSQEIGPYLARRETDSHGRGPHGTDERTGAERARNAIRVLELLSSVASQSERV